jgi:hypothetical protein
MTPRTDHFTAASIALALFLRHMVSHRFAAELLARRGVPLAIARRVLTTTRRRGVAQPKDCS